MGCGVSKPQPPTSATPVPYSANAGPQAQTAGGEPTVGVSGQATASAPPPEPQEFLSPGVVKAGGSKLQLARNPFQRSDAPPTKTVEADIKDGSGRLVGTLTVIDSSQLKESTVLRDANRRVLALVSRLESFDDYSKYAGVARVFAAAPREVGQQVERTFEGIPLYAWATIGPGTFKYRFPVHLWAGGKFLKQPAMIVVPQNLVMSQAKVETPSGHSVAFSATRKTFDIEPGADPLLVLLSVLEIGYTQTVNAGTQPAKPVKNTPPLPSSLSHSRTSVW